MLVEQSKINKNSAVYAEIISEIFVEAVTKSANEAMSIKYGDEEITQSLMECLHYVFLHGACSVRQIAFGLEISVPAASQLVDRLVRKGLVTRSEDAEDRRLMRIDVTDAGREIVKQMRERRSKWFASILEAMPENKRLAFLEGIESFLKVALADDEDIDRTCDRCGMAHVPFCVVNKVKNERGLKL